MDPTYRNLTAVFTVGTVILWCLTNFLLTCDPDLDVAEQRNSYGKGAENKQGAVPITGPLPPKDNSATLFYTAPLCFFRQTTQVPENG